MPYRRLPNTDSARVRALRTAIERKRFYLEGTVFSFDITKLEALLRNCETPYTHYKRSLEAQSKASQKLQKLTREARLYVSHFIQVLNLCIMRNEIKASVKNLYNLPMDNYAVPDLSSNDSLLEIGQNIIEGENKRLLEGGTPIYNPSIARVKVAYSLFKDALISQKQYQNTTNFHLAELTAQRTNVDSVIKELWDQIETFFANKPERERLSNCREFGVVYYYRKGEENIEELDK